MSHSVNVNIATGIPILFGGTDDAYLGTMIHGRNFDFSVEGLPKITLQLSFTRKGKVVYKGSSFAGYIGLITAMRPVKLHARSS